MGDAEHVAQPGTVIEWLADCFDVGLAAMALAFRARMWSLTRRGTS